MMVEMNLVVVAVAGQPGGTHWNNEKGPRSFDQGPFSLLTLNQVI